MSKHAAEIWLITKQICISCKGPSMLSTISPLQIIVSSTLNCFGQFVAKVFCLKQVRQFLTCLPPKKHIIHQSRSTRGGANPSKWVQPNLPLPVLLWSLVWHLQLSCHHAISIGKERPLCEGWGLCTARVSAQTVPTRLRQTHPLFLSEQRVDSLGPGESEAISGFKSRECKHLCMSGVVMWGHKTKQRCSFSLIDSLLLGLAL